jgi:hypothetical protein
MELNPHLLPQFFRKAGFFLRVARMGNKEFPKPYADES